jgi:glutathione S-transferase
VDLFYGIVSGNSARAVFGVLESGAPFVGHPVDASKGEHRDAWYVAHNPMGKMPSLVDGAFTLWESNAINGYVAEKHPESALLPKTIEGRAAVQRWLYFQVGHVSPACLPIFRATVPRVQAFWSVQPDAKAVEAGRKDLGRFLPVLEEALARREWLEGPFSLADIAFAPHFWLIAEGGFDFSATPAIRAWLDRLFARPAWRKTTQLVWG